MRFTTLTLSTLATLIVPSLAGPAAYGIRQAGCAAVVMVSFLLSAREILITC